MQHTPIPIHRHKKITEYMQVYINTYTETCTKEIKRQHP